MACRTTIVEIPYPGYSPDRVPTRSPLVSTPIDTVFINGAKAVAIGSVAADKSVVIEGSRDVYFEGIPASRYADMTTVGGIITASDDVYVNNR